MTFRAKYSGWCGECGEAIHVGDEVEWAGGAVVHVDCDELGEPVAGGTVRGRVGVGSPLTLRAEVCTTCWLERPCPCDDDRKAS